MLGTSITMLRRWMAIDCDLYRGGLLQKGGLRISEFAEAWMVDRKTIRRDLAMFKQLGYPAVCVTCQPGVDYVWRYPQGKQPMFTESLPSRSDAS
jgi:hypothetical protein